MASPPPTIPSCRWRGPRFWSGSRSTATAPRPSKRTAQRGSRPGRRPAVPLLVGDARAGRTGEREHLRLPEPRLLAPAGEVGPCEVERLAELDQHVERHQQPEGVLTAGVVD